MLKVLIIQTASLGDLILATATAQSIRNLHADAQVSFIAKSSTATVLNDNPVIHRVFIWNKSTHKYRNLLSIIRSIRKEKFDVVINLQRYFSSGLITVFSKAKVKVGFRSNPLSFLFSQKLQHIQSGAHEIVRNLSLAKLYFPELKVMNPFIIPEKPAIQEVEELFGKKYITVFPGSLWPTKQFPTNGWKKFVSVVPNDISVVILGSDVDSTIATEIIQACPSNSNNLCGRLSVRQAAWMMKNALMNYTNDSAPTHLASAVNANVTTIFCSTVPEFGFTPLSENSHIVQCLEKLQCRPCGVHGKKICPAQHFHCGNKIETNQLTEFL